MVELVRRLVIATKNRTPSSNTVILPAPRLPAVARSTNGFNCSTLLLTISGALSFKSDFTIGLDLEPPEADCNAPTLQNSPERRDCE